MIRLVYRKGDAWSAASELPGTLKNMDLPTMRYRVSAFAEALRSRGLTVKASDEKAERFCLDITSGTIRHAIDVVPWLAKRLEEYPIA